MIDVVAVNKRPARFRVDFYGAITRMAMPTQMIEFGFRQIISFDLTKNFSQPMIDVAVVNKRPARFRVDSLWRHYQNGDVDTDD
ncbi:hypothetical protein CEXT_96761 [Caerostris extrusa]|uniref:Uncharacterized protein n=1 Tax=Caerostris extrusa TaxID=172846 RepID=A0AAV4RGC4_CAEEX|nr:hypothetical protein CEXT_96761 [Caerostris extrusa]